MENTRDAQRLPGKLLLKRNIMMTVLTFINITLQSILNLLIADKPKIVYASPISLYCSVSSCG